MEGGGGDHEEPGIEPALGPCPAQLSPELVSSGLGGPSSPLAGGTGPWSSEGT